MTRGGDTVASPVVVPGLRVKKDFNQCIHVNPNLYFDAIDVYTRRVR